MVLLWQTFSLLRILVAISFFLFVVAKGITQDVIPDEIKLTYTADQKALKEILSELSEKAGVTIAYQDELLPTDSLITYPLARKPLGLILYDILSGTGTRYKIVGNQIVLVKDIYHYKNNKSNESKFTISGYLKDVKSGEFLVHANVYLFDRSAGTTTNEYGFYSLTVPKGLRRIYFSYAGYKQAIHEIELNSDITFNVELDPYIVLNEVVITDARISKIEEVPQSQDILMIDKIGSMLPLGGESDVIRLSHFMPGVSSGADGFGGLSVRGGSIDQNLILLDGVPIYNPNHALGLYSIFNANIIKSSTLIKGSFPARYGGMLASVLDIRTREGNRKKITGDVGIGLLAAKATLEGPIGKSGSFLISGRRTFSDIWINSITEFINNELNQEGSASYYFYDLNAKFNIGIGKSSRLYVSAYNGQDKFDNEVFFSRALDAQTTLVDFDELRWDWGNTMLSARLNTKLSKKAFLNTTVYSTSYNYQTFDQDRFEQLDNESNLQQLVYQAGYYSSSINDLGARMDFDFIPSPKHQIRTGLSFIRHQFNPGLLLTSQNQELVPEDRSFTLADAQAFLNEDEIVGNEFQLFFEDAIATGKHSRLTLGFHQSIIQTDQENYSLPQPRIAFLSSKNGWAFKTGLSFVSQYLHLLTNNGLGVPADVWLPSTDNVRPQTAWVSNLGLKKTTKKDLSYGFEVFYKKMNRVVQFAEGGFLGINDTEDWDSDVPYGTGTSYGVELSANKTHSKFTWLMNLTLSRSLRQFDEINNGEEFPYRFDRRYAFKSAFLYRINDHTEFSLNWTLMDGSPISLPSDVVIRENIEGDPIFLAVYPSRNNQRLPIYHRMDIGFNFYNKLKYGSQKFTIGVYNAYNRANPYYLDVIQDDVTLNAFQLNSVTLLPILPTISYNLNFN